MNIGELKRLAEAATPGPWRECGHARGGCMCGIIWAVPADSPIATATIGVWGDSWPEVRMIAGGEPEAYMERCDYGEIPESRGKANAAYIAAISPDVALKLIAVAEVAQELQNSGLYLTVEQCANGGFSPGDGNKLASALAALSQPEDGNG